MINKTYIKLGIKRIREEIYKMEKLPDNFYQYYMKAIKADKLESVKECMTELMNSVKKYLNELENTLRVKNEIKGENIKGSYEEIYSNWKNKMHLASETKDSYLSFMTSASCQNFYDEMFEEFNINRVNLMKDFDINDLEKSENAFNMAMEQYKKLYIKTSEKIVHYDTIEEFEGDYCS